MGSPDDTRADDGRPSAIEEAFFEGYARGYREALKRAREELALSRLESKFELEELRRELDSARREFEVLRNKPKLTLVH
jgi:flagellar biosynthesis/type III secretory pathway protein FliH